MDTSVKSKPKPVSPRLVILNLLVLFLSLFSFLVFIAGSYDYFRNMEDNKCEMTYMYEFPQYVKIGLNNEEDRQYPMYGLYAYTEGKHIETVRQLKFTGIPVLFLPGNKGSYKQVRSFASVALRKWLNARTQFHFDFFSLDFNDEISGVYGYVLKRQSEYTKHAVNRIMSLYEDFHHVVIIGHSMGGLVAKTLNDEEAKVDMIYTLATPHLQPVLITDPEIDLYHFYISKNWTHAKNANLKEVTLVSLAGGDRDLMVPNKLTRWKYNTIHTSTSAIPTVWASSDHLCIVWCKQIVMAVVRTLFDMVELRKKFEYYAISDNATLRQQVLNYHILQRTSGKTEHSAHPTEVQGANPPSAVWTEYLLPDYCQAASNKLTFIMFPMKIYERFAVDPKNTRILVSTTNTRPKNWIFGCKSQTIVQNIRICSKMVNLSNQTQLLPSYHRRRKIIHLNYDDMTAYSHLIVKLDPFSFPCCVNTDAYNIRERSKIIGDKFTTENKIFYKFQFPLPYNISRLFAWRLSAKLYDQDPEKTTRCDGHHNSVGIFRHGNYQTHNFFKNESVLIRFSDWTAKSAEVDVYLDKNCNYMLSSKLAWIETAGQIFRTYWRLLPSYFTSIILMSLAFQPPSGWNNFPGILLRNAYYLTIIPGFVVAFGLLFIPNDYPMMMDPEEYTVFLPFVLYFVAFSLVLTIGNMAYFIVLTVGNSYHSILMRFFTKKLGNVPEKVTELVFSYTFEKFPVTIAVLIIAIALSTCGTLGFGATLFFFLVKIFKSYEDILQDLVKANSLHPKEIFSTSNFHFHCSILWFAVTLLNLPSLIYWIENFSYGEAPQWDLSLYLCLILTPALSILWQGFTPDFNPRLWKVQRCMCFLTGIFVVIWGSHRLYIVSFLIVIVILTMAGCQLISLMAPREDSDASKNGCSTSDKKSSTLKAPGDDEVSNSSEDAMTIEDSNTGSDTE